MQEKQINGKIACIVIFGENKFENLQLLLSGWIRNLEIHLIGSLKVISNIINVVNRIPFIRGYVKKSIKNHNVIVDDYKGSVYRISEETIHLTTRFYAEKLKSNTKIIAYYSRLLNTNKFETYIKGVISTQIFTVLKELHLIRLSRLANNNILLSKNPINEYIIAYMERKYRIEYHIKWVLPGWRVFSLFVYYGWLFVEFMKRGIVFNKKRKSYKLSMEAAWGFCYATLRNDALIDNKRFRPKDILMLQLNKAIHPPRIKAFKEAKERGFDTVSLPELKINIRGNIFHFLSFYFSTPAKIFFRLFSERELYLFYYVFLFHKRCFPVELLLNLYDIKCHISVKDWGDIEETIILNKYGTKNVLFHWSDLTGYKEYKHAFTAHNVFFSWGDIHYDFHSGASSVDTKINIGCIYKKAFSRGAVNKNDIISRITNLKKRKKIVTFFDTSISDAGHSTEHFFLEYLELMKEFCEGNKNVNVLLKPKPRESYELQLSSANRDQYRYLWDKLTSYDNFNYLDASKWGIEETIAISDACVSMGMNTPSTIALICGKNGLYFDNTDNIYHPFARKYRNKIVFENKDLLLRQINNILKGKFNCRDVITEKDIREYDAFPDDNALERLRENLYELTEAH